MNKDGTEMEYSSTHDLILDLKKSKEEQGLSFQQITDMLAEIGVYPSKSTLQRVFDKGSENKGFNYEATLRPLMRVLIKNDTLDGKIALYEDALQYKAKEIESLHAQIEALKADHEKSFLEYQKSYNHLQEQVDTKDRRMDEQAKRIDAMIALVEQLIKMLMELMKKI